MQMEEYTYIFVISLISGYSIVIYVEVTPF